MNESQNSWGWRDLWKSPGPATLPRQDQIGKSVQDYVHLRIIMSTLSTSTDLHKLSEQPPAALDHCQGKEEFSCVQIELPFGFCFAHFFIFFFKFVPTLSSCQRELHQSDSREVSGFRFSIPSHQEFLYLPHRAAFSLGWTVTAVSVSPHVKDSPVLYEGVGEKDDNSILVVQELDAVGVDLFWNIDWKEFFFLAPWIEKSQMEF